MNFLTNAAWMDTQSADYGVSNAKCEDNRPRYSARMAQRSELIAGIKPGRWSFLPTPTKRSDAEGQ